MIDNDKIAIKEMAQIICLDKDHRGDCERCCYYDGRSKLRCSSVSDAEKLYAKGYRKQRTAEWVTTAETEEGVIMRYTHRCTGCNYFYKTVCPRGDDYCHKCGAKMKGSE